MCKKRTIASICLILVFVLFCLVSLFVYRRYHAPIQYPGTGVYDLTKYYPCTVSEEMETDSLQKTIIYDFVTDSTKINVRNTGSKSITVYLYDTMYERYIGSTALAPGKKTAFTNLTSARQYRISVETEGQSFALTITD